MPDSGIHSDAYLKWFEQVWYNQSMNTIPLSRGKKAVVCDCHIDSVVWYKWYCAADGYAVRDEYDQETGKRKVVRMHRAVNDTPEGLLTDHINRDRLDNRCINLRTVSTSQNMRNSSPKSTNTSGYKGVTWDKKNKKWSVVITKDRKAVRVGRFSSLRQAALAYNHAAKNLFGDYAYQNEVSGA